MISQPARSGNLAQLVPGWPWSGRSWRLGEKELRVSWRTPRPRTSPYAKLVRKTVLPYPFVLAIDIGNRSFHKLFEHEAASSIQLKGISAIDSRSD
jgi:hypothetical protein